MSERLRPQAEPSGVEIPENIDLNYREAYNLFKELCGVKNIADFSLTYREPYDGLWKGDNVRLLPPLVLEADREEIIEGLLAADSGFPGLRLNTGLGRHFAELAEKFRAAGISIRTSSTL